MKQKTVLLAGLIGLIFGLLLSATLGLSFFPEDEPHDNTPTLKKDEEGFKTAYNLTTSIYMPIFGDDVQMKMDNDETFILYIGRDTCPYCQQFVPELMEAAENQGYSVIYHVDTVDPSNKDFVDDEGYNLTPTTVLVKDGMIVETILGYKTAEQMEQYLLDNLS